jgi:hypothetical protein
MKIQTNQRVKNHRRQKLRITEAYAEPIQSITPHPEIHSLQPIKITEKV